jgi:hypothetical protein
LLLLSSADGALLLPGLGVRSRWARPSFPIRGFDFFLELKQDVFQLSRGADVIESRSPVALVC